MEPVTAGLLMAGAATAAGGGMIQQGYANRFQREEGKRSRRFNAEQAQLDRDWQEQMRSTQYQTARDDMRAAGINPLLMAGGKAQHAGTPSGASASSSPVSFASQDPVGKAIGGVGAIASLRMAAAQARQAEANATLAEQGAYKAEFFGKVWNEANRALDALTEAIQSAKPSIPEIRINIDELKEKIPRLDEDEKRALREKMDALEEYIRNLPENERKRLREFWEMLKEQFRGHNWTTERERR